MKLVIKGVLYNVLCVLIFTLIYVSFKHEFTMDPNLEKYTPPTTIDLLYLSSGIQSGVGFSVYPLTDTAKITIILQQFFMILTNLFLIYLFTI